MDLFRMDEIPTDVSPDSGVPISGWSSVSWTERYREPGEFKLEATLGSGLREALPIGSFLGHVDSPEIMVVEDHVLKEDKEGDQLSISGRSLETVLGRRVAGEHLIYSSGVTLGDYVIPAADTWNQVITIVNEFLGTLTNRDFPGMQMVSIVSGTGTRQERAIKRDNLHKVILEILAVDDVGIRSHRYSKSDSYGLDTSLVLHKGEDRTDKVIFSWKGGDVDDADYLWTDRDAATSVFVIGRYTARAVYGDGTEWDRYGHVLDASDIDGGLDSAPTGSTNPTLSQVYHRLRVRGLDYLARHKPIVMTRADVSKYTDFRYRRDYNIGDIVRVDGNYGEIQNMRVMEYVEIEDENGESGHPTLEPPLEV